MRRAYLETESTVAGIIPDSPELGRPLPLVTGIADVVPVDVFIPGCPPRADDLYFAIGELLAGRVPVVLPTQHFKYD